MSPMALGWVGIIGNETVHRVLRGIRGTEAAESRTLFTAAEGNQRCRLRFETGVGRS